jgi:hypothetical protein
MVCSRRSGSIAIAVLVCLAYASIEFNAGCVMQPQASTTQPAVDPVKIAEDTTTAIVTGLNEARKDGKISDDLWHNRYQPAINAVSVALDVWESKNTDAAREGYQRAVADLVALAVQFSKEKATVPTTRKAAP